MDTDTKAKAVLGWKLAMARRKRSVTQAQAAAMVGVNVQTLSNWERGVQTPSFLTVACLASYLVVPMGWLADPGENLPEGGFL